jgi:hypothetical protein
MASRARLWNERTLIGITVHNNPGSLTFWLEVSQAGPWVRELKYFW